MKTTMTILLILVSLLKTTPEQKSQIDITKSQIKWSCDYVFYFNGHHGTIDFQEGFFIIEEGRITGGEFIIDMNSIVCLDITDKESNESLVNHIKDPDFFDVPRFPKSKLTVTKVNYRDETSLEILADLEIKDKTLPVQFRAKIDTNRSELTTKFKIDRTRWEINYNSTIKDGAISDAIGFEVVLSF